MLVLSVFLRYLYGGLRSVLLSFAHRYGRIRSAASVMFSRVLFYNIPGEKGGDRFDYRRFTS